MTNQPVLSVYRGVFAGVAVAVAGGIVWIMAGAPDSAAKVWLIAAWIVLAALVTACGLNPGSIPRPMALLLLCATIAVPLVAWSAGAHDGLLLAPFGGVAFGFLGVAFPGRPLQEADDTPPA